MRIKKFFEADETIDISNDRVNEIIDLLTSISQSIDNSKEKIKSLTNELTNYRSNSKKSNDQIDDSVANLEMIFEKFDDILSNTDVTIQNLKSYNEDGRKYLY